MLQQRQVAESAGIRLIAEYLSCIDRGEPLSAENIREADPSAQAELTDVVFVELPAVGRSVDEAEAQPAFGILLSWCHSEHRIVGNALLGAGVRQHVCGGLGKGQHGDPSFRDGRGLVRSGLPRPWRCRNLRLGSVAATSMHAWIRC